MCTTSTSKRVCIKKRISIYTSSFFQFGPEGMKFRIIWKYLATKDARPLKKWLKLCFHLGSNFNFNFKMHILIQFEYCDYVHLHRKRNFFKCCTMSYYNKAFFLLQTLSLFIIFYEDFSFIKVIPLTGFLIVHFPLNKNDRIIEKKMSLAICWYSLIFMS